MGITSIFLFLIASLILGIGWSIIITSIWLLFLFIGELKS